MVDPSPPLSVLLQSINIALAFFNRAMLIHCGSPTVCSITGITPSTSFIGALCAIIQRIYKMSVYLIHIDSLGVHYGPLPRSQTSH
ncbi:hypothetical protein XELAEV_18006067mg [Xenopus laevis]|uniref:Uncharacterized protein n=1 Tax=Xenopus laevis TaxID=8355 RepID=A0A974DYV7_XENLA|nr:hypothetical protein XELAEV_18006067mg [Xenopus laevis]